MAETKDKKCAHPSCSCVAAKDSNYCGTYCEGKGTRDDILCDCGHPDCTMKA